MKLTVDPAKADPLFVYYLFRAPAQQEYLKRNAIQTGVPHTNLSILRGVPLRVPCVKTQRAIAHILGTLDDKIELNRRMSETLEGIARALFKSWFVDFEPVRAKAEGRETGLPKEIEALFPDRLVESEIGEVPEGWGIRALDSIACIEMASPCSAIGRSRGRRSCP
jgi:type I restriction enzyme S subunit